MTKAKTKSRRVWIVLNVEGRPLADRFYALHTDALAACLSSWSGAEVARATLAWTPPAKWRGRPSPSSWARLAKKIRDKTKKRSAKR